MPPRRRATSPPPIDVDAIRAKLDEGRLVRVGIASSAQFPDGVVGRVRRVGDPAVDGDEYIFVEVPIGGVKDILPFAVSDLTPTGRGSARPVPKTPATIRGSRTQVRLAGPSRSSSSASDMTGATARSGARAGSEAAPSAAVDPPARGKPLAAGSDSAAGADPDPQKDSEALFERSPKPVPSKADRARGRRPPVTITVSTTGEDAAPWRVEARIGARIAVRATSVSPSRVWEIVQTLGDEKLSAAVRALLDDHRRVTQAKADALAAELAAVHTELSLFPVER